MDGEAAQPADDGADQTGKRRAPSLSSMSGYSPHLAIAAADAETREALAPADPDDLRDVLPARQPQPIRRRSFFNDMPDRGLFVLFAVTGFIAITAAKASGLPVLPATLMSVVVLFGYAFVSSRLEWFRLHPDRLGDNCYYMGFLFTLASLSAALIEVQNQSPDGRDELLERLIGNFGVALFSTIGGILLRVFFMQMRREIEDVEEVIRNELQDAARLLKDQMGAAVQSLEGFRLRTTQVMDEQLNSAVSEFTTASRAIADHVASSGRAHSAASERLAQGAEKAAKELSLASETMTVNIQAAGASHQEATERLVGVSMKVAGEVDRLVERIDNIEVPTDLVTRQVEDARQRISAVATALEAAAESDTGRQVAMQQATASLDRLLRRLTDLSAFSALEQSAARLPPAIEAATAALRSVGDQATSQASTMAELNELSKRDAVAIAKARAAAQADLEQSTVALHRLQETLAEVAETLVKQLGSG